MKIEVSCANCIFSKEVNHPLSYSSYTCSKGMRPEGVEDLHHFLCKYWRPEVRSVEVWINREEEEKARGKK